MKRGTSTKGFTLIEAIVYAAIFVVLTAMVFAFLIWAIHFQARSKALQETRENAQRAMNRMALEVKAAQGIYSPTTTATSQLSLETTEYVPAGETSSYIDFFICAKRLCIKKESQNPEALTSDTVEITSINFLEVATASTTPSVQVTLTAEYKNPGNRAELDASVTLASTAALRAY